MLVHLKAELARAEQPRHGFRVGSQSGSISMGWCRVLQGWVPGGCGFGSSVEGKARRSFRTRDLDRSANPSPPPRSQAIREVTIPAGQATCTATCSWPRYRCNAIVYDHRIMHSPGREVDRGTGSTVAVAVAMIVLVSRHGDPMARGLSVSNLPVTHVTRCVWGNLFGEGMARTALFPK